MSNALKYSPAKRPADDDDSGFVTPTRRSATGRGQTGETTEWYCPYQDCDKAPLIKKSNKKGTSFFVVCANNVYQDKTTCGFTASLFRQDQREPHLCRVCVKDVGGTPSLGRPTKKTDSNGKTVWENFHVYFEHCVGRKAGGKLPACTRATSDYEVTCAAFEDPINDDDTTDDLREGCPGLVKEGELLVKEWREKPLHARCGKRIHKAAVDEILERKREQRLLGTTSTEENETPSALITEDEFDL